MMNVAIRNYLLTAKANSYAASLEIALELNERYLRVKVDCNFFVIATSTLSCSLQSVKSKLLRYLLLSITINNNSEALSFMKHECT